MWSEGEVQPKRIQRENRRGRLSREPGDIFTQHSSPGTSRDKKINESSVCTSTEIQFQAVTEEAAQPELKALLNSARCSFIVIVKSRVSINL